MLWCAVFLSEREKATAAIEKKRGCLGFFFFDAVCSEVGQGQLFYTSAGGFAAHTAVM